MMQVAPRFDTCLWPYRQHKLCAAQRAHHDMHTIALKRCTLSQLCPPQLHQQAAFTAAQASHPHHLQEPWGNPAYPSNRPRPRNVLVHATMLDSSDHLRCAALHCASSLALPHRNTGSSATPAQPLLLTCQRLLPRCGGRLPHAIRPPSKKPHNAIPKHPLL